MLFKLNRIYSIVFLLSISCLSFAQNRYLDSLFSVEINSNITYGNNINVSGNPQSLELDIYQPSGDLAPKRPLIIFAHGGFFLAGSKENPTMVELCTTFAQMGYVTASIEYRLGVDYLNLVLGNGEEEFKYAVMRATHDMRAVVRFFRQDASTNNLYRIDTNNIIVGGSSAGAFTALHLAYFDDLNEALPEIPDILSFGGIAGNSGNQGYSSDADITINLCGAIGDTAWIKSGDEPLVSIHGDEDETVPYGIGTVYLFTFAVGDVMGSYTISQRSNTVGLDHHLKTFYGQGHVPYEVTSPSPEQEAFLDTTINVVKDFLYPRLQNPYIKTNDIKIDNQIEIYPNPAKDIVYVKSNDFHFEDHSKVIVYDVFGKIVFYDRIDTPIIEIDISHLEKGIYFFNVGNSIRKLLKY